MQQDLLSAQNTANALSLGGGGGRSGSGGPVYLPSNNSNNQDDENEEKTDGNNVERLALVLGGVAAVATVITLTRK